MVSTRYKELSTRVAELRKHLLPRKFSLTGDYTDCQLDRARGYRVLVHAEIESYLEDIVKEVVTNCIHKWKQNKKPSSTLIAFLASYHSSWNVNDDISNQEIIQIAKSRKREDSIFNILVAAQKQFINLIEKNHGIKENNLKSLILPTGVDINQLDQTWLANLDSFGKLRGEIAHKTKRTTTQVNPKDEFDRVKSLLKGLKDLDVLVLNQSKY